MREQSDRELDGKDTQIDFLVYLLWAVILIVLLRVVL